MSDLKRCVPVMRRHAGHGLAAAPVMALSSCRWRAAGPPSCGNAQTCVHAAGAAPISNADVQTLLLPAAAAAQPAAQTVRITNGLRAPVEGDIRPGASDRYSVSPARFRLLPGEALDATVTLRLPATYAQRQRAIQAGQRDPIYIKVAGRRNMAAVPAAAGPLVTAWQHAATAAGRVPGVTLLPRSLLPPPPLLLLGGADLVLRPALPRDLLPAPGRGAPRWRGRQQQQGAWRRQVRAGT